MIFTPPVEANKYFLMYGKVLYLCQHFERLCKSFVYDCFAFESLKEKEITTIDLINGAIFINRKGKIVTSDNVILGSLIKNKKDKLINIFGSKVFIDLLNQAISNRNYIIHDSLVKISSYSRLNKTQLNSKFDLEQVLLKINPIISSIYHLIAFEYEINENEKYMNKEQKNHYVELVIKWLKDYESSIYDINILILSELQSLPHPFNIAKNK